MKYLRDEEGIKKFGLRLKQIRQMKGLTQEKLAWLANIEPMQVSKIERGVINTSLSHILNLAKALEISPKDFFD
ncbi:MAG TPA: helix-turn-helix transcriptional regulator [Flavipsychrobacter sp.]|nr:helix-turn-helix transcriptional regulator [Flavipsychrobacter sp.]